ncbi:CHASE2 domain-containing protein [Derxia gummosa]|uniref:CHASE2 domain-containing protein n=1 Tax=Derxia gummosa DSM 723 TaxID=1121388 RepID=A0A8B6XCD3_9BURK|nr:CHASE2 domain-containing protein [Derxia gummosa]
MPHAAQAPRLARERKRLALALALFTLVLGLSGLLRGSDDALYDIGLTIDARPTPPDDIVIIAIDDASLAVMGRWPWSRATHARLLERIAPDRPRAVLLDLLLSEPSDLPEDDAELATAMARVGPVVLPVVPVASIGGERLTELRPAESLGDAYRLGHADAELDPDGILRRSYLHAGLGAPRHPHVALALLDASAGSGDPAPDTTVTADEPIAPDLPPRPPRRADTGPQFPSQAADGRWRRADPILLRHRGGADHYAHVSYADVLLGRVPPGRFHDRFVLIGVTATGLGDGYPTPLSGSNRITPSIDIIATLLDSLRRGDAPWTPQPLPAAAFGALIAGLLTLGITRLPPRAALVFGLGSAAGAVALAWVLLGVASVWLPPAGIAIAALLACPLWSWRRLEAASRFVDDELDTLAHRTGPELGLADGLRSPRALRRAIAASRAAGHAASARPATPAPGTEPLEARLDALAAISQSLRDGRDLLAEALAALPEPVFVTDPRGLVLLANPPAARFAARLAGDDALPPATLAGRQLPELLRELAPGGASAWTALLDEVGLDARPRHLIGRHPRLAPQRIHVSPLGRQARPDALVVCLNSLGRAVAEPALAGTDADHTGPRTRPLGAYTPPSFVDGLLTTVTQTDVPAPPPTVPRPDSRPMVSTQPLSGDFVQAMRLESGGTVSIGFDLAALLSDAIAEIRAEPGGQRLPVNADAPAGAAMKGDPALMRRALAGLVAHAVRAGGDDPIAIRLAIDGDHWRLALAPAAPGMPSAFVERVVEHHAGRMVSAPLGPDRARLDLLLPTGAN